jgi:hypothetical protein
MINERLRERLLQDYDIQLQRTQMQFDRWRATQEEKRLAKQMQMDQKRFKFEKQQFKASRKDAAWARTMDRRAMKLERDRFNAQKVQFAQEMGLSVKEFNRMLQNDKWAQTHGQKDTKQREYILAKQEQMVAISDSILTGTQPTYKTIKVKDNQGNEVLKTVIDKAGSAGLGGAGPMKVLRTILAKAGVSDKQKKLYNFAIGQVIRAYEAAGYVEIPRDPKKWRVWWKKRTAPGKPPLKDQPPAPPGSNEYIWDPKKKKWIRKKH